MTTCCDHKHLQLELSEDRKLGLTKLTCWDCGSLIGQAERGMSDALGRAPFYLAKDLQLTPR